MSHKKIVVCGNFAVGKTNLIRAFIGLPFESNYRTTVRDKSYSTDHATLGLTFLDLPGEVFLDKIPKTQLSTADCILYVFDLSRSLTFQYANENIEILKAAAPQAKVITIGNKLDLIDDDLQQLELLVPLDFVVSAKKQESLAAFRSHLLELFQK